MKKIIKSLVTLVLGITIGATYHREINSLIPHQFQEVGYQPKVKSKTKFNLGNIDNNNFTHKNKINSLSPHKIDLCFTPPSNCGHFIANEINQATTSLYMQAYGLTHNEIVNSMIKAKQRGVNVRVLLDRSNLSQKYSKINELQEAGIEVSIDRVAGIAQQFEI